VSLLERLTEALGAATYDYACMVRMEGSEVVFHVHGVDLAHLGGIEGLPFCDECQALPQAPPVDYVARRPSGDSVTDGAVPDWASTEHKPKPEQPKPAMATRRMDFDDDGADRGWTEIWRQQP
jgi:hypothetical protein